MEKKIIKAQDILKEKNFSFPPFNTEAFTDAVVSFFRANEVSASFPLISVRFANLENTPSDGFAASTEAQLKDNYLIYYDPSFIRNSILGIGELGYSLLPSIYINEVYMENAVALLKMLGFVVGRPYKGWKGRKSRLVSLV